MCVCFFFFQAEDGIRDLVRSRGLGDVYKRQVYGAASGKSIKPDLNWVLNAPASICPLVILYTFLKFSNFIGPNLISFKLS